MHALKFAEMALAHELTSRKGGGARCCPTYQVAEARLHMEREDFDEAKKCLKKALMADIQDSTAWALLGHTHFLSEEYEEAQDAYERTLGYTTPPVQIHLVYTRLAHIYLAQEKVFFVCVCVCVFILLFVYSTRKQRRCCCMPAGSLHPVAHGLVWAWPVTGWTTWSRLRML